MPLSAGEKLGPYEILAPIGAGGMGEVYKARDTRLNRVVAIKTSRAQFNERFAREARAIAALNHPNIATLYDIGPDYLVMELVEGEPVCGPLPHDEALRLIKQIAEAIEAAHEKGIVHRDLKPGNILRCEEGKVKVLDFGLAKALEDDPASSTAPSADSPTLTLEATRMGMILGTAAYMSPEQAKGKRADRRSDIFSFGVVLYELLTGQKPFKGESTGEILAAVIKEEPSLDGIPENWRGLIERRLVKDPRQRLQAIGEARILLEGGMKGPAALDGKASLKAGNGWKWAGWAVAAFAVAATVFAFLYVRPQLGLEQQRAVRVQILTPDGLPVELAQISPDGGTLAILTKGGLWLRRLDSLEAKLVPGTEGARFPFWSADSENLGFFQQGKLRRIAVQGGPAVDVCNAIDGRGGTWSQANVIVFAPGPSTGLYRVAVGGGTPEIVVKPTQNVTVENIRYPSFLPDGQHFLYEHSTGSSESKGFYLGALDGTAPIRLRPDFTNAVYAAARSRVTPVQNDRS
jgi:predicted Ser/Thr protein kinase